MGARGFHHLLQWIEAGYAGEMGYFEARRDAYRHPSVDSSRRTFFDHAGLSLRKRTISKLQAGHGRIARYAWSGTDYHDLIHPKLKRLCRRIEEVRPGSRSRGVVDTAPLLEREVANQAGLGWCGKNTLLLNRWQGSYFFLACVLTDVELPYDEPHASSHCGTCTACLQACPTDAFPQPGVLDASRCISYLTIEHREAIPSEFRAKMGDWLFGCDVCQEVCPWNRKPARLRGCEGTSFESIDLRGLFDLNEDDFRSRFRRTPLWRPRRRGLLRNAAIVLGNQRMPESVNALTNGLNDAEAIVRGASAWALGLIGSQTAIAALKARQENEQDPSVREEIKAALGKGSELKPEA